MRAAWHGPGSGARAEAAASPGRAPCPRTRADPPAPFQQFLSADHVCQHLALSGTTVSLGRQTLPETSPWFPVQEPLQGFLWVKLPVCFLSSTYSQTTRTRGRGQYHRRGRLQEVPGSDRLLQTRRPSEAPSPGPAGSRQLMTNGPKLAHSRLHLVDTITRRVGRAGVKQVNTLLCGPASWTLCSDMTAPNTCPGV